MKMDADCVVNGHLLESHGETLNELPVGIQFYLLLSPYLCFSSFLYLDLYVLGDDALIS